MLGLVSSLTLFLAVAPPAWASAHHGKRPRVAIQTQRSARHLSQLTTPAGSARGRTLIFGGGDQQGGGAIASEPITDLENSLTSAGYGVDVSTALPTSLAQYTAVWFLDTEPLTGAEESELEAFVKRGNGLYLTGERPCCDSMDNASDSTIINALVRGGGIQVGGLNDADDGIAPEDVNASVIDDVAANPNVLSTWTPNDPGGMAGVAEENILTSTAFGGQTTPTGAVWDGSDMTSGKGRIAILMDINWLETQSESYDPSTAPEMAANLERFLLDSFPVPTVARGKWAGYAAIATGVRDVNASWTVPTVDCGEVSKPSAASVWVGIDGLTNNELVKAGTGATCSGPTATPCYYAFEQVLPGAETPMTACSGVSPGDVITVDVTNNPFGSSTFVVTTSDNGNSVGQPLTLTAPSKRDKSAECVVQLPPGNVGPTPAHYKELADFGTVTFSSCAATATEIAGNTLDTDQLETGSDGAFSVRGYSLGSHVKPMTSLTLASLPDQAWSVNWLAAK